MTAIWWPPPLNILIIRLPDCKDLCKWPLPTLPICVLSMYSFSNYAYGPKHCTYTNPVPNTFFVSYCVTSELLIIFRNSNHLSRIKLFKLD